VECRHGPATEWEHALKASEFSRLRAAEYVRMSTECCCQRLFDHLCQLSLTMARSSATRGNRQNSWYVSRSLISGIPGQTDVSANTYVIKS
jgi:hypothetical protein